MSRFVRNFLSGITLLLITVNALYAIPQNIAVWADNSIQPQHPYYSIYDGSSWSAPEPISTGSFQALSDVYATYNPDTGEVVATWTDGSGGPKYPYYSVYNEGTWTTPSKISLGTDEANSNVYCSYNASTQQVIASWKKLSGGFPFYATYQNGIWSTPAELDSAPGIYREVYTSFDPITNETVATWTNDSSLSCLSSIYDGTNWSNYIQFSINYPRKNIYSCFDGVSETVIVTWADRFYSNYPYYSSYNGTTWSVGSPISSTSTSLEDVTCSYNPSLQKVIATWKDITTSNPFYSIYDGSTWTMATPITSAFQVKSTTSSFSSFDSTTDETIVTWVDSISNRPYYSLFNGVEWNTPSPMSADASFEIYGSIFNLSLESGPVPPPSPSVEPPTNFTGSQFKNDFGTFYELYNALKWTFSSSDNVAGYNIYSSGIKIATVGPLTNKYNDHNKKKGITTFYTLTSFDSLGNESSSISLAVN